VENEKLRIEFGGNQIPSLYDDLVRLEVELDDELSGMARITLAVVQRDDGQWPYLDDERLRLWQPVTVDVALGGDTETLLAGYITHLRPDFAGAPDQCLLEIWAMDATVLMDRREILKAWPNRKDSDIAQEIFSSYGVSSFVTDTAVVHDDAVSTIVQGETDIRFLKRLARRNGFECFVSGHAGYFQPPSVFSTPQPVLSVLCGPDTNVTQFSIEVEAVGPTPVAMAQIDHTTKEVVDVCVDTSALRALGAQPADAYRPDGATDALAYLGQSVTTGQAEMQALCQAVHDMSDWFVTAEGEVAANWYGAILRPRKPVVIRGVGQTYSGVYYVTRVTHVFGTDGYTQVFTVKRNALKPTDTEDFTNTSGASVPSPGAT
jgi:phage protein D